MSPSRNNPVFTAQVKCIRIRPSKMRRLESIIYSILAYFGEIARVKKSALQSTHFGV